LQLHPQFLAAVKACLPLRLELLIAVAAGIAAGMLALHSFSYLAR